MTQDSRTPIELSYHGQSAAESSDEKGRISLFGSTGRDDVHFRGRVRDPLKLREVFSTLYEVVKSDFRYVPKDRSAYLAWKNSQNSRSRDGGGQSAFRAQKEYFDWLRENDPHAWIILDPVVTAHPDKLMLEVFSKDEGTYARVDVAWDALELDEEPRLGTTNVDFSKELFEGIQQMRRKRTTELALGKDAFGIKTENDEVLEKRVEVPNSWLRGFLQVQSAATLPEFEFELEPMQLYNVLRTLRMNADQKGKGRSIRAELTPGEKPRLVLEPWEHVIESTAAVYQGQTAEVVRIWGRRRLMMVKHILPYVERIRVRLMGSGLPGFWVFDCGDVTLTLGLTGFVASNWSKAVHLDVLLPTFEESSAYDAVVEHLKNEWSVDVDALVESTDFSNTQIVSALQRACRKGLAIYDIDDDLYRFRPLTDVELDESTLQFRNDREREAHDLVDGHGGSVELTGEHEVRGRGTEYAATVTSEADMREYETSFQLTHDGRLYRPSCTCAFFRKHQLKEGPCPHLYALRLLVARRDVEIKSRRGSEEIVAETSTYVRRHDSGEDVYTLTFDHKEIRVEWGLRAQKDRRFQRLMFNDIDHARQAYLARIADLETRGFLDATE